MKKLIIFVLLLISCSSKNPLAPEVSPYIISSYDFGSSYKSGYYIEQSLYYCQKDLIPKKVSVYYVLSDTVIVKDLTVEYSSDSTITYQWFQTIQSGTIISCLFQTPSAVMNQKFIANWHKFYIRIDY